VHLVHKLMQRCRLGFLSQRTQPIHPIGPRTPVLVHYGPFRHRTKIDLKRAELVQLVRKLVHEVALDSFATNTPDPPNWILNSCFAVFRTDSSPHENRCKMGRTVQLVHKFVQRSRVRIFHYERTRSSPLDPKHMFWCISDRLVTACFGAFWTVSSTHEN
jgi:hypothetical protein